MEVMELHGVGPVLAARLEAIGLGTVETLAKASPEDLAAVAGVGPRRAAELKKQSVLVVAASARNADATRDDHATVSRAVRRLRRHAPDLAKSKKHAKTLRSASKRMSGLVGDLDSTKSRKRLIAESSRIREDAKKRTGSKRDARGLRKLADQVENAVRSIA